MRLLIITLKLDFLLAVGLNLLDERKLVTSQLFSMSHRFQSASLLQWNSSLTEHAHKIFSQIHLIKSECCFSLRVSVEPDSRNLTPIHGKVSVSQSSGWELLLWLPSPFRATISSIDDLTVKLTTSAPYNPVCVFHNKPPVVFQQHDAFILKSKSQFLFFVSFTHFTWCSNLPWQL